MPGSVVLAVSSQRRNLELLCQVLAKEGHPTRGAATLAEFDAVLADPGGIGLALVDLPGFDAAIWERCEKLRAAGIPFLVISAIESAAVQQASLVHGARGVLVKPLAIRQLLELIKTLLSRE